MHNHLSKIVCKKIKECHYNKLLLILIFHHHLCYFFFLTDRKNGIPQLDIQLRQMKNQIRLRGKIRTGKTVRKILNLRCMHRTDFYLRLQRSANISQQIYTYFKQRAIFPTEQKAILSVLFRFVHVSVSDNEIACNIF